MFTKEWTAWSLPRYGFAAKHLFLLCFPMKEEAKYKRRPTCEWKVEGIRLLWCVAGLLKLFRMAYCSMAWHGMNST